jgi:cell division protein ZapB
MKQETTLVHTDQELDLLEKKLDELLDIIRRLTEENQSLRSQQEAHAAERAGLIERHDQVRNRVEAIVTRLKAMETST